MNGLNGKHLKVTDFQNGGSAVYIKKTITQNNPGMLLIYADWCGHCQRFKPIFNEIHSKIGKSFSCVSINDVELERGPELAKALAFRGFPTIKFFDQNGKITQDYTGDRQSSEILTHICKFYHRCY